MRNPYQTPYKRAFTLWRDDQRARHKASRIMLRVAVALAALDIVLAALQV